MPHLFEDFIWRAVIGGVGVAIVAGPLGCFVVWGRMAYFGDSLAHGALLGVALGFALSINLNLSTLLAFCLFAVLLVLLQRQQRLATDTLLGILSHAALSLGLVTLSFMETVRVDLMAYLFGDILSVTREDLIWIYGGGALALGALLVLWSRLLAATVHEELARAEGVPVTALRLALMLMMALVIVIAMKIIGILLITALLIIPPATARYFARTPEQMAVLASAFGSAAVLGGIGASMTWDTPSGPSVVVVATLLFLLGLALAAGQGLLERSRSGGRP